MRQLFPEVGDVGPVDACARLAEADNRQRAQLASAGLLDMVCLTVSPMFVAANARRVLDGSALDAPTGLLLGKVPTADGRLFLRHRRR